MAVCRGIESCWVLGRVRFRGPFCVQPGQDLCWLSALQYFLVLIGSLFLLVLLRCFSRELVLGVDVDDDESAFADPGGDCCCSRSLVIWCLAGFAFCLFPDTLDWLSLLHSFRCSCCVVLGVLSLGAVRVRFYSLVDRCCSVASRWHARDPCCARSDAFVLTLRFTLSFLSIFVYFSPYSVLLSHPTALHTPVNHLLLLLPLFPLDGFGEVGGPIIALGVFLILLSRSKTFRLCSKEIQTPSISLYSAR